MDINNQKDLVPAEIAYKEVEGNTEGVKEKVFIQVGNNHKGKKVFKQKSVEIVDEDVNRFGPLADKDDGGSIQGEGSGTEENLAVKEIEEEQLLGVRPEERWDPQMQSVIVQLDQPHEDVAGGIEMGKSVEEIQLSQNNEGRGNQLLMVSLSSRDSFYGNHQYVARVGVNTVDDETGIVRRTDPPDQGYWSDDGSLLRQGRSRGQLKDIDDDDSMDSESDYLEVGSLDVTDRLRPRSKSLIL
ncbi:unnamed protein product [Ilex paraguariensis]|uniref:Uncharacterized protein n=1 Tax=Ilex paraguariensis TaxID=185542 RepID=A0ABC8T0E3_9AQUA